MGKRESKSKTRYQSLEVFVATLLGAMKTVVDVRDGKRQQMKRGKVKTKIAEAIGEIRAIIRLHNYYIR